MTFFKYIQLSLIVEQTNKQTEILTEVLLTYQESSVVHKISPISAVSCSVLVMTVTISSPEINVYKNQYYNMRNIVISK